MITYIIKSGLCLALILLIYKVMLERERMYVFNRYYLLFGLCFALTVPFITMETVAEIPFTETASTGQLQNINTSELIDIESDNIQEASTIPVWILVTISLYSIGYLLFFFRFVRNIYLIINKIIKSVRVRYRAASLVLLKENVLPHTFLHYIFLKKEAYDSQNIAEELYTHELAHVTQKHSLDIILIELIQIVFWFNPLLIYYKKAIQLNHEFLADDAVLKSNTKIPTYQHLLLENANWNHNLHLASNLNFSVTKKRLQMMTKHTTRARAWMIGTLTIPVFISALFLFSTKVIAQKTKNNINKTSKTHIAVTKSQDSKADYYKDATFIFEDAQGKKTKKTYAQLSTEEKARLIPPPPKPTANQPNKEQLNAWKNKEKFAIWLDGKVIENSEITKHKIVHYTQSFVYKNARSKRFPQSYQTSLYTEAGFKSLLADFGSPLNKKAVLHFKEGKHSNSVIRKKVGTSDKVSVRHELSKINELPINYVNEKNGPNEMDLPLKKETIRKVERKDIVVHITKEGKFIVNHKLKSTFKGLDKNIKSELNRILHKRARNSIIIYHEDYKQFVAKVTSLLKENKIYDIETINIADLPPPPPPPAPKKPMIIKEGDVNKLHEIVVRFDKKHKISVNDIVLKSIDKLPWAIKNMASSIKSKKPSAAIIHDAKDDNASDLKSKIKQILKQNNITEVRTVFAYDLKIVPPPPPPPAPKNPTVNEIKLKNKAKNKAKSKSKAKNKAKDSKKVVPKVIEVKEVPKKELKEKQLASTTKTVNETGTYTANGKKIY
ncbi:M56 family metallopeptidase [Kordia sp.]|uniref:M56 family metallopeptidase n=1 Tax=Kordia sp. TaxID=1965332 RepID=UPI0025C383FC|nr:M56 family metallopeptidase [Kordia sp.]MCH2192876.1 M56 family metallopeptidase [Kordia sp.]